MPLRNERLCVLMLRVSEKPKNSQNLFATLPIALLMATNLPVAQIKSSDVSTPLSSEVVGIELRLDTPHVVLPVDKTSKIIPGESVADREAREKAEAEAKALAEAKAKQKALARKSESVSTASDPANFDDLYRSAGNAFGVNPLLLKAIHQIETGASGSTNRSNPSGATGPMQFLPSTFRAHAVDGNGDGIKSVSNVSDAIYSAAKYLVDCGYPDLKKALWGYNPSTQYYNKVLSLARSYGMQ